MRASIHIALGFTEMSVLFLVARHVARNLNQFVPELLEPVVLFIGVPVLLFCAGLGLARIIKGGLLMKAELSPAGRAADEL